MQVRNEEFFYREDVETLKKVAQRGVGCPIPGYLQGNRLFISH